MLMNNNASLQENNNLQISASTAVFLIDALRGAEYSIVEDNGRKYIIWQKGPFMGGRQSYDSFVQGIEGSNSNLEMAKAFQLDKIKATNPEFQQSSYFDIVINAFANASDWHKNNCLKQAEAFNSPVLKSAVTAVVQALYGEQKAGMYDTQTKDNVHTR